MKFVPALLLIVASALVPTGARAEFSGEGSFPFTDDAKRPITVWYYAPKTIKPDTPVLFVMHGADRNARQYRDTWIEHAQRKHAILLAPEFSKAAFPDDDYNLGGVMSPKGKLNDRSKWAFTAIEKIFDRVKEMANLQAKGYVMFGHSAGAQFVHRMILFMPEARIERAVAANAGWYTMPEFTTPYPYGLKDAPVTADDVKRAFSKKLTLLLGAEDTNEKDKNLRSTPAAEAQGENRLDRGKMFFKTAKQEAAELGCALKWDMKTVPHVGHSNADMAPTALSILF